MPFECALRYGETTEIEGNNTVQVRGGVDMSTTSEVIAMDHAIAVPMDSQTGRVAGNRTHGPMIITKYIDRATPLLYQALCQNQNLEEIILEWWRASPDTGEPELYFKTTLYNVRVSAMNNTLPNTKDPGLATQGHMETLKLNYQKINWEWVVGGLLFEDSWSEGRA